MRTCAHTAKSWNALSSAHTVTSEKGFPMSSYVSNVANSGARAFFGSAMEGSMSLRHPVTPLATGSYAYSLSYFKRCD